MNPLVAIIIIGAVVNFGPEALSLIGAGTQGAWEYAVHGLEAAGLWSIAFLMLRDPYAKAAAAWCLFEALQRPACRLAFPMGSKPAIPAGQSLCEAAYGVPASAVSVLCALALVALAQEVQRAKQA